jgi:hypothetical protein
MSICPRFLPACAQLLRDISDDNVCDCLLLLISNKTNITTMLALALKADLEG